MTEVSDQVWAGVRQRVAALGAAPGSHEVFGALGHGWVLEEPLTEGALAELETQLGVRLPEEYRTFLTEVGAGGAGPSYGVFPARRVDGAWRWEGDGADLTDLTLLAEPFPEKGPDPEVLAALLDACPEEEDFGDDLDAFDTAYEAWDGRLAEVLWAPERTAGAIALCHLGCAQREWLIVSGPHRGTIWSDPRVDEADLEPPLDAEGAPVTYAGWYLEWLTKAESAVRGRGRE
ncbi:SMI1/KNR4 family protein [Streptomyces sp. NPDC002643]